MVSGEWACLLARRGGWRSGRGLLALLSVPTLDAQTALTIPPGTQPGQMFRVKGEGTRSLGSNRRGDLLVRVDVEVPTRLND